MKQGLGLFSIQERIQLIGGTFNITSSPGNGSRFDIVLPFSADDEPFGESAPCAGNDVREHSSGTDIRVLLADDHAIFRKGVFQALREAAGIRVVGQAHDGMEVVELAEKFVITSYSIHYTKLYEIHFINTAGGLNAIYAGHIDIHQDDIRL